MSHAPKLVIKVMDGMTVFTKVTLNGEDIQATRVSFDTGEAIDGMVKLRIECYADIDIEVDGELNVLPLQRSLELRRAHASKVRELAR